jgi:hypothetical protein
MEILEHIEKEIATNPVITAVLLTFILGCLVVVFVFL